MRSHVRRHSDGDTRRSVQKEERKLGRHNDRLLEGVVEVRLEIDRILVHVAENVGSNLFKLGLGISHGSDRVAVH